MEDIKMTTNRKLEGYLYALGIKPISHEILWDGMVQWAYRNDATFRAACDLYKSTKTKIYKERIMS